MEKIILCFALTIRCSVSQKGRPVVYGKYYSDFTQPPTKNFDDNSYWLYIPPKNLLAKSATNAPLVMHFYGNGWKLGNGPFKDGSPKIAQFLSKGIAVASVGYRRITCQYWYDSTLTGVHSPEEFIDIGAEGSMTLDATGKTFKDYSVRISRHEMLTKPTYDSVKALEHLIQNAMQYGIDMHRVFFWCYSAGGTMSQYLSYVYHAMHQDAFTPKGIAYDGPMLDVPTANILDRVWEIIEQNSISGPQTMLKDLISQDACWWVVGSGCEDPRVAQWFSPDLPYSTCNRTWHQLAIQYCDTFDTVTVGELKKSQVWMEDSEFAKGLANIWYASRSMLRHTPAPFHVYLQGGADPYGLIHSPLYIPEFKRIFDRVGTQYAIYYDAVAGMIEPPGAVASVVTSGKFVSNHDWHGQLASVGWKPGSWIEPVWYACLALQQPTCSPTPVLWQV